VEAIDENHVRPKIIGMGFDTCSANSGVNSGAGVLIEREFGYKLLYNPCRHHIIDIPNRDVFHQIFGVTTAPYYPVFKKFRGFFDELNRDSSKMRTITYRSPFLCQVGAVIRQTLNG
jgi:hypothetical protein